MWKPNLSDKCRDVRAQGTGGVASASMNAFSVHHDEVPGGHVEQLFLWVWFALDLFNRSGGLSQVRILRADGARSHYDNIRRQTSTEEQAGARCSHLNNSQCACCLGHVLEVSQQIELPAMALT